MITSDNKLKIATVLPKEGATGWSDTWMVSSKAKNPPNCMYQWMDWITSPQVNAQVAEYFGEAPRADQSLRIHQRQDVLRHLSRHRFRLCGEDQLLDDAAEAMRGRSGDNCTAYNEWVDKWQQIKG